MLTVHNIIKMELQSITKGNFNLEQTQKTFSHANKLLRHARKHYKNYVDKVKNDNLTGSKRRKITTERYNNLKDICQEFDNLSGPQRHERLVEFLGLFARRDAIPDNQFEFAPDSDTEVSNSENESE